MRVLILAPVGRDAVLLAETLAGMDMETATAHDSDMLLQLMAGGFGAIVVTDEALTTEHLHKMRQWLSGQPPWSDPPFIILTPQSRPSDHSYHRAQHFSALGNFTLIERPMRPETILSAVRAALRGRMKQYEVRSRQEALLQANADLEQFAYSASHDLKEPLRNISIFSELLDSEYNHALNERGVEFLQRIRESSNRMDQLLDELLAYAQASSIPDDLPEPIPAGKSLEIALANLASAISEKDARIIVGELPIVRMREIHLAQVFQNLIGNAIKYQRPAVTPRVCVASKYDGGRWIFSIADNGIGIAREYRESIFGIFKRLHTTRQYGGTGMGLAICQRIVERHRGRIWVESEPGHGSTFFFTIPS